MTNYNDGKWHGWNGGEYPVHPNTVVDVFFADGQKGSTKEEAKVLRWSRISSLGDIIAFRVVKEYRESRECWAVGNHMHGSLAEAERHTPGGVLLEHDLDGLRKRVARRHGITPEDLKRWEGLYRE